MQSRPFPLGLGAIPEPGIDPLLTVREAAALLQLSVPTFWRRVADRTVPRPLKLGGLSRWPRSEVLAVIDKAKAARASG